MSLVRERYGDVDRLRMTSVGSRAVGLDVSAYVVRGVMVDTGFPRAGDAMAEAVDALSVRGAIVTHWHEDHAGNVALLARRGIPLLIRQDTEAIVRSPDPIQLYRRVVWGSPPPLDSPLLGFDPADVDCIHTPGHSADHQVVFDRQTGTLFSGDLWLGVRARIVHSAEDPLLIIDSLHRAMGLSPDRMFDAHRGPVDWPVNALRAKAEWLTNTLGEIERRIGEGWSDREIVRRVLGGEEIAAALSRGEYARRNLVKAVRRRVLLSL
jgi:glyoxylase-like metal-dependent hydrolase (beta-lactamase superfamily II)